jgi:arsenical pump membrane protein
MIVLHAAQQAWQPFVLVVGLLLIGQVAQTDNLFEALGARCERIPGNAIVLLTALLLLEAAVTAQLNLDTAVVFMTPVLLHAARHRGTDERAFLYGSVAMANSASLLLPGSNLTNLIVIAHRPLAGREFAANTWLAWLVAVAITIVVIAGLFRPRDTASGRIQVPSLRIGVGLVATVLAGVLVVALHNAALPVLAIGAGACALRRVRPRINPLVILGLFLLATALGTLARVWHGPEKLLLHADGAATAAIGALTSVVINNLPAAALLAAQPPAHPFALLLGLNLGPNLAVTDSLSAFLWLKTSRAEGASASIKTYTLIGLFLVPATLAAGIAALAAVGAL